MNDSQTVAIPLDQDAQTPAPAHHSNETLRTDGLCKSYGGRLVVDGVSIELRRNEIVGLLGPNGAGKTTSFNMVVGIIKPLRGRIYLEDRDITTLPLYKRARLGVGYLAQDTSIFRKLSVEDNIMAVLEVVGLTRDQQRARLEELMDELGVSHLAKNVAYTLSGGERRRVEIARALASNPRFMLLDEPFSGVDPKAVEEIQEIIRHMSRRGIGILITDHSVRETLAVTDRSYIIYEGKIRVAGTATELVNNPEARRLYLGERFYMQLPEETGEAIPRVVRGAPEPVGAARRKSDDDAGAPPPIAGPENVDDSVESWASTGSPDDDDPDAGVGTKTPSQRN
jgi:lipopolysaccharide export system ATP-binding protein